MSMMLFIFLSTLISASLSQPVVRTWPLNELSMAIETHTNEDMQPYLIDALNQIMYAIYTGKEGEVLAIITSPTGGKTWTREQLRKAIDDQNIDLNYKTYILSALHQLSYMHDKGKKQKSIEVTVPALDISVWTISDVEVAKNNPSIKPALLPYLKKAEDNIQEALKKGEKEENVKVTLVTPVGLVPAEKGTYPTIISRNTL